MTQQVDTAELLADEEHAIDFQTFEALKRDAMRYTKGGRAMFAVSVVVGVALLAVSYHLTGVYVDDLNRAKDGQLMLLLLVARSVLWGGLSVGFLYGLFTVGNAYIDQATRFRKRLYSAHMLNYAFKTFSEDIKHGGKVEVDDLVRLFAAWNANVDSAFSRVKFQKNSKDFIIGGKNGGFAIADPARRRSSRKGSKKA
ncbi:MAG TPA: hypothetical protein VFV03_05900 [Solirubrobacteraceae bacterium]|nr:hypothetical protein [Solirubrobacteraceae bacterium]